MLQQTQVARVVDRFTSFMKRFPTPADLASADQQEVLALWQGLGYYRRARHLHQAAQIINARFGGKVPTSVDDLLDLPGVGKYTAGAIASIVYGQAVPIVDGNVHRVLARLEARRGSASDPNNVAWTWGRAEQLVQVAVQPGRFNEAIMELGSTICAPRKPKCATCPVARHCKAKRNKIQQEVPGAKRAAQRKSVHHHAVAIQRGDKVLVEQRPATGLWAGLWQVPTIEDEASLSLTEVASRLPVPVVSLRKGGSFEHHTSHRRIRFHVITARSRSRAGTWLELRDLDELPMSNAQRRVLDLIKAPDGRV